MKKKRISPEWFNFGLLVSKYYQEYFRYFIELNPGYLKDLRETLFPAFLEIYSQHQPPEPHIYTKDLFYQAVHLVKAEDKGFYQGVRLEQDSERNDLLEAKCVDFAKQFRQFIKKYRLYNEAFSDVSNHALAHTVYFAIYIGEPHILNPGGMLHSSYPEKLLEDLWNKFPKEEWVRLFEKKIKWTTGKDELGKYDLRLLEEFRTNIHVPRYLPPAEPFQLFPSYDNLLCSFYDYERIAVNAFREHIKSYLSELKKALETHGIKRYKAEDPIQIQRLVTWNHYDFEHLWEVIPYIPEFSRVDMSNEQQVKSAVDVLRKSFNKLEQFNMPVRPFGKKRKNNPT